MLTTLGRPPAPPELLPEVDDAPRRKHVTFAWLPAITMLAKPAPITPAAPDNTRFFKIFHFLGT